MSEDIENDPTDTGTKRPNVRPLKKTGNRLIPMELPDFEHDIQLPYHASADDPITLFMLYYSVEIVEEIVPCTNLCFREPQDPTRPRARAHEWYPTSSGEIYVYLALRIYMTLNVQNEIADYWDTRICTPNHHITKHMSRDRFQELRMRFRCHRSRADGPFAKVCRKPNYPA
jgi:hypothetical protein